MDERIYLPQSAWRSHIRDVVLLSENAETYPAQYTLLTSAIDINEPGAATEEKEIDYWLKDFVGHTYRIIEINVDGIANKIKIEDSLGCGQGPQVGQQGIIYKSVGNGTSPYLAPIYYRHLDKSALEYSRQFELDILWEQPDDTNIKYHIDGLIFSGSNKQENTVSYTDGSFTHHLWAELSDYKTDNVIGRTNYHPDRTWQITGSEITFGDNNIYHIYVKVPIDESITNAEVVFSDEYRHERYYNGYILVLIGVCNEPNPSRTVSMLFGNSNEHRFLPMKAIDDAKELTGFVDPSQISISYSHAQRTVTLSGNLDYYWRGEKKALVSPWTSSAHSNSEGKWFLYSSDGDNFIWSNTPWNYTYIQVAFVYYKSSIDSTFGVKETHGLMPYSVHEEFHQTQGTYLLSGGKATAGTYLLNTATDQANTPGFDVAVLRDEDNPTVVPQWIQGTYTTMWVGPSNAVQFSNAASLPFVSSGGFMQVNNAVTGAMTDGVNQRYYNVYQILIPTTSDIGSQKFRTIMLQPQATYLSLADATAEDANALLFGDLTDFTEEFKIYARLTYTTLAGDMNTGKCRLASITYIQGTKVNSFNVGNIVASNHTALSNLQWNLSGHVGDANKIAGFDNLGNPIYLEIPNGDGGSLPDTITSETENVDNGTTHTHELGLISIDNIASGSSIQYGALYNWYAAVDTRNIANTGWHLPTLTEITTLGTFLDPVNDPYTNIAGGMMKEDNSLYWASPNIGATNSSGFTARAAGHRLSNSGVFDSRDDLMLFWTSSEWYGFSYGGNLDVSTAIFSYENSGGYPSAGYSIRLIKDTTTLSNGQKGTYVGNDGKLYETICIGTQEWLASSLNETKYRNGDWIHGYDNGVYSPIANNTWSALTTEAMCYYDDNENYGGGITPLNNVLISKHGDLSDLGEDNHPQYLTQSRGDARYLRPASSDGKTYGLLNGSWVEIVIPTDNSVVVRIDFQSLDAFVYTAPVDLKFTALESESTAPTLSVPLNTNLNKFNDLTITPTALGLVILTGIQL